MIKTSNFIITLQAIPVKDTSNIGNSQGSNFKELLTASNEGENSNNQSCVRYFSTPSSSHNSIHSTQNRTRWRTAKLRNQNAFHAKQAPNESETILTLSLPTSATLLLLHVSNFPKLPALLAPPAAEKWVKLSIHHPTRLSQNLLLSLEKCAPAPSQVNDLPACSLWENILFSFMALSLGVLSLENFLYTFVTLVFLPSLGCLQQRTRSGSWHSF